MGGIRSSPRHHGVLEQGELKRGSRNIAGLGPEVAGDKVDLYTGAVTLQHMDVDLPGNNALRVAWGRKIDLNRSELVWDPEIPRLHGIFSDGMVARQAVGWLVGDLNDPNRNLRCSHFDGPPEFTAYRGPGFVERDEFWSGNRIYVPGETSELLLARGYNFAPASRSWPVITKTHWQLSCIPLVLGTGEGFIAMSPDGTRYRFDRMVSRRYSGITGANGSASRQEIWILPSEVRDRFDNTVTYSYDPANPWRVTSIVASDGRRLDMAYAGDGSYTVTAMAGTADARVWNYSANGMLVTQPDGAQWAYTLSPRPYASYSTASGCNGYNWTDGTVAPQPATSTVTTPSGARVELAMQWTLHGTTGLMSAPQSLVT